MNISELISALQRAQADYGDMECVVTNDFCERLSITKIRPACNGEGSYGEGSYIRFSSAGPFDVILID